MSPLWYRIRRRNFGLETFCGFGWNLFCKRLTLRANLFRLNWFTIFPVLHNGINSFMGKASPTSLRVSFPGDLTTYFFMRIGYRPITSNVRSNENDELERKWPEGLFTYSRCSYTIRRKKQGNSGQVMNHSIPSASRIPKPGPLQYHVDFLTFICRNYFFNFSTPCI